jgi:hypothetical protein
MTNGDEKNKVAFDEEKREGRSVLLSLLGWSTIACLTFAGWLLSQKCDIFSIKSCYYSLSNKGCQAAIALLIILPIVLICWNITIIKLYSFCRKKVKNIIKTNIYARFSIDFSIAT